MENRERSFLEIENLTVHYSMDKRWVEAVNGVSLRLEKGRTLGLVGETGAGKTTIAKAIMKILPTPPAKIKSGKIYLGGEELLGMEEKKMLKIRGNKISMIFQDPMTALNPIMNVGSQISEVLLLHNDYDKKQAKEKAIEMLKMVGIPAERYREYPHQFSGGMKQRVVIAMALACSPELLLADEPTTALDVTIQAQVLDMIADLREKNNTSMIMITHDLGVVARVCDDVAVVYAGEIIESGSKEDIFDKPSHPYTIGLFGALPKLNGEEERLHPIEGMTPDPTALPQGCKFSPRCPRATESCRQQSIAMKEIAPGHFCRCIQMEVQNEKRALY